MSVKSRNVVFYLRQQPGGKRHAVGKRLVIGRQQGDLRLITDPRVSGRHCRVTVVNDTLLIEDLGSSNGTLLEGQPVKPGLPRPLQEGQSFVIGQQTFTVETGTSSGDLLGGWRRFQSALPAIRGPQLRWLGGGVAAVIVVVALGLTLTRFMPRWSWQRLNGSTASRNPSAEGWAVTIGPYMSTSSADFDRLIRHYAALIDRVMIDGWPRDMAVAELTSAIEPVAQRLLRETENIKVTTSADRAYVMAHHEIMKILLAHMNATRSFWQTGESHFQMEADQHMSRYLAAVRDAPVLRWAE